MKGICSICGRHVSLVRDDDVDVVDVHDGPEGYTCNGSGQKPRYRVLVGDVED